MSRNLTGEYVNQEAFESMTIRKIHGTMAELLEISCYIDGGQTIGVIRFFSFVRTTKDIGTSVPALRKSPCNNSLGYRLVFQIPSV